MTRARHGFHPWGRLALLAVMVVVSVATPISAADDEENDGPAKPEKKGVSLREIRAVFIPPDSSKTGKDQCTGLLGGLGIDRCSTLYTVKIPQNVGKEVKVAWELKAAADLKCGTTKDLGLDGQGRQRRAIFAWKHDHPHQGGNCKDEYPHAGRTIAVTVTAKKWKCTAEYTEGAAGIEYDAAKPKKGGQKGPEPPECEAVEKPKD